MYNFGLSDFDTDEFWRRDGFPGRPTPARALVYTPDELAAILALWADAFKGEPIHTSDRLRLPLADGGHVDIAPTGIQIDQKEASPEALRAAMLHIAAHWQGRAVYDPEDGTSRQERLRVRAYAEVYGVEIDDVDDHFRPSALTAADLATLPALRKQIRETHPDAPPARPDEEKQLAAMYARRYPFRGPVAA